MIRVNLKEFLIHFIHPLVFFDLFRYDYFMKVIYCVKFMINDELIKK